MRYPSVKTLSRICSQPLLLRKLIDGRVSPTSIGPTAAWARSCYNTPSRPELIMHAANYLMEGYGVEPLRSFSYDYVNMGDPYVETLIFCYDAGRYTVGCWGDLVE